MKKIFIILLILIPIKINAIGTNTYIVMDIDNNRVLEGNNINKESLIASTTKIMTALITINNSNLNKIITVPKEVLKSYGSGIYIEVGEHIKIEELLYGLMLRSGNDAAIALANEVASSMEGFTYLMNEQAKTLNMNNTNFINNHGLEENEKGNTSTPYDMALLSSYVSKIEEYNKIVMTKKITVKTDLKTYIWHNKNKLLNEYKYCTGGKTGYTKKAKRTLVTTASKNNINLTVVTFNDKEDFNDHKYLYEKYFNKLNKYKILSKGKIKTKYNNTYLKEDIKMSLTKEEYKNIKININYYEQIKDNIVGNITININGKEYNKTPIYIKENNKNTKETLYQKIKRYLKKIL